jgi:hypothetical protein
MTYYYDLVTKMKGRKSAFSLQCGDFGSISPSNLRWNSLCFVFSCFFAASLREGFRGSSYRYFWIKLSDLE